MDNSPLGGQQVRNPFGVTNFNAGAPAPSGGGDTTIIIIGGDDVNLGGLQGGDMFTPAGGTGIPGATPPVGGVDPTTGLPVGGPTAGAPIPGVGGGGNEAFLASLNETLSQATAGLQSFLQQIMASSQAAPTETVPTDGSAPVETAPVETAPVEEETPTDETTPVDESEPTQGTEGTDEESGIPVDGDSETEESGDVDESTGTGGSDDVEEGDEAGETDDVEEGTETGETDDVETDEPTETEEPDETEEPEGMELPDDPYAPIGADDSRPEPEDVTGAADFLLEHADDVPSDGSYNEEDFNDAIRKAIAEGESAETINALRWMRDDRSALSGLDGHGGDLNETELRGIKDLMERGFTYAQVVNEGISLNEGDDQRSTLLDMESHTGFNDADDEAAQKEAVQYLIDHAEGDGAIPSDGSYNADDIREAAEEATDPDVQAQLELMADNVDALSELDGHDGDLNLEELESISDNLDNGFSLVFQVEEGQLIKDGDKDYRDESNLADLPSP